MTDPFVSIIIPVLDDTNALERVLPAIALNPETEVIVVNGGAPDDRLALIADRAHARLLASPPARGRQMNLGALAARGRWLLFLHADTRLPSQWLREVRLADADLSVVGGSFRFRLESDAWQARIIERCVERRVRWLDLAYGDQALFVRREAFHAVGGYRKWPLMEDVALIRDLRRVGRLYHSPLPVLTSARRWQQNGWWRRSAGNVMLQILFFAGVSPAWLAVRYARSSRGSPREALIVMARAPSDSRGKSRLTRGLPGSQIELRRAMLLDTLDVATRAARADLCVAVEPPDALDEMRMLVGRAPRLFSQQGETLGDRMRNAFAARFEDGYTSIVMIGSDLPTLPPTFLEQAFDRLAEHPNAIVIGPATDGGYYLIGFRAPNSELFKSIPWGTPDVLAATLDAARQRDLSVSLLPPWYDVDEPADLRRVLHETGGATRTRAWIAAHESL